MTVRHSRMLTRYNHWANKVMFDAVAALPDVKAHPGTFGLAGASISVGRNSGSGVSRAYKAPFAFTGGTIALVNVDVSGKPYADLEREFARAFAKD